ncbi:MAG: alpha/beta hydrolase [Balneolaceae bacterium]
MHQLSEPLHYRDGQLAYRVIGEGKPLIVLHGWGSSSRVMEPASRLLAPNHTCYLIDLPGFGLSPDPPEAWAVGDYAELTGSFIRSLNLPEADLLVHSFGGRIALKLLSSPEFAPLVGKVLITGGAGMKPKRSVQFYFKKYLAKTLKAPLLLLPGKYREQALNRLRATSLWKSLGSSDYRELTGVLRETFVKSVTEHLEETLPLISHEILLLWGREDKATPLYQAERMEKGLKNSALVVIEGAGHYAFLDQPKQFTAIAEAFFKGT